MAKISGTSTIAINMQSRELLVTVKLSVYLKNKGKCTFLKRYLPYNDDNSRDKVLWRVEIYFTFEWGNCLDLFSTPTCAKTCSG